ncbi:MAG: D-alanyl-D-alanine carboxypeptidase [Proteobacteria bacterium]|nr:D-alanyl-D-alanine carboxypeptidase [Pseudomonadota bacterium]
MIAQIQRVILHIKTTFKISILLALLCPVIAHSYDTAADFAILQDYNTGTVLYEKKADEKLYPSSMSKLMTLYVLYKQLEVGKIKLTDTLNITENAWKTGGSKMFVQVGTQVSIEDLINGIAVQSGNDACVAVAEGLAGNEPAFAEQMNKVAQQLGMSNSHFTNSSGLPDDNHYSTARDLLLLSARIIGDFPQYYPYLTKKEFSYNGITQGNRNLLLGIGGVDGLKTGHTEAGGYGIVISAERNGQRLIGVINGLPSEIARKKEAESLLNYGFGNFDYKMLYKQGQVIADLPLTYGKSKKLAIIADKNIAVILPKMHADPEVKLVYNAPLVAPIKKDEKLADLVVTSEGKVVLTRPLMAQADIQEVSAFCRIIPNLKFYLFGG